MLEPWVSPLSRIVYGSMHHEPFTPDAMTWELPRGGPLSSSNQALPWIVFQRDRASFTREFPRLLIKMLHPTMPLRYFVSGGVGTRNIVPAWTLRVWRGVEDLLSGLLGRTALFALITLELAPAPEDARKRPPEG